MFYCQIANNVKKPGLVWRFVSAHDYLSAAHVWRHLSVLQHQMDIPWRHFHL